MATVCEDVTAESLLSGEHARTLIAMKHLIRVLIPEMVPLQLLGAEGFRAKIARQFRLDPFVSRNVSQVGALPAESQAADAALPHLPTGQVTVRPRFGFVVSPQVHDVSVAFRKPMMAYLKRVNPGFNIDLQNVIELFKLTSHS